LFRSCPGIAQIAGEYHLGEFVNRFRHGSLVMKLADSDTARLPTLLFGTINGVIGVIASVPQAQFTFLSRLQVRNLVQLTCQPAARHQSRHPVAFRGC
jgi:hypothetical protein